MKKIIYLITALILIVIVFAQPPTFHQFYGTVKYSDGTNAADGTLITATVNSIEFSTVTSEGKYGYSPLFLVENANNGDLIEFFANGNKVSEYTFEDGSTTQLNLIISDICGDSLCTGSETCSSCATDCGACPDDGGDNGGSDDGGGGGGSGGGGGGGGGGSGAGYVTLCTEDWECGVWSTCSVNEVQRRTCKDENDCGTIENKPAELRKCIYEDASEKIPEEKTQEEVEIVEVKKELPIPIKDKSKEVNLLIAATLTLLLILVATTYKLMKFKKKPVKPKKISLDEKYKKIRKKNY